jgi:hypothetical protein
MRVISTIAICSAAALLWSCNNLEDAPESNRRTFLKIFEGPYSITATDLELTPDGYAILGNMKVTDDSTVTVVFRTDKNGNRATPYTYFTGGTGNSFAYVDNGTFTGYIVVGDSIKSDPSSPIVANIDVASARVLILDANFQEITSRSLADTTESDNNPFITDFYGESVTVGADGRIYLLGTYREGVSNQLQVPLKPFIFSLTNNLQRDWVRSYDLINRNYSNGRSIHAYNNKLFWASAIARVQGDFTFSYVSIPVVQDESTFVNYSLVGETTDQLFEPKDIQPAQNPAFGFGVVGTYSLATDGTQGNIFFLRTDANGNIISSSIKYFDAIGSANGDNVASDASQIIDHGESITATQDGGYALAGTFESNPDLGKGLKDIIIIKLDAVGNTLWIKKFGGEGDDDVVTIKETTGGDLLICGTSTIGTYSTPILIKTDKNGEIKK